MTETPETISSATDRVRIAAARLRVTTDAKQGLPTPAWVITLAQKGKPMACKHCGRAIEGAVHSAGTYRGKMRCDPGDSGLPYGYNAEPEGEACQPPCLGAP